MMRFRLHRPIRRRRQLRCCRYRHLQKTQYRQRYLRPRHWLYRLKMKHYRRLYPHRPRHRSRRLYLLRQHRNRHRLMCNK
jgi:hypothetical protein